MDLPTVLRAGVLEIDSGDWGESYHAGETLHNQFKASLDGLNWLVMNRLKCSEDWQTNRSIFFYISKIKCYPMGK